MYKINARNLHEIYSVVLFPERILSDQQDFHSNAAHTQPESKYASSIRFCSAAKNQMLNFIYGIFFSRFISGRAPGSRYV